MIPTFLKHIPKQFLSALLFLAISGSAFAQTYSKEVLTANRERLYKNIVERGINGKLSTPLNIDNESDWASALGSMMFLQYHSPYTKAKIALAVERIPTNSEELNRALLTYLISIPDTGYVTQIKSNIKSAKSDYVFALMANYLLLSDNSPELKKDIKKTAETRNKKNEENAFFDAFSQQLFKNEKDKSLEALFAANYLPGKVIMYSIQRKNRDWPGLVLIRDTAGKFMKNTDSSLFAQQQLARSVSNLPYYFFNGNTPQGIFRMSGFDISRSAFIGPTTNVQLTLPFEFRANHFYADSLKQPKDWNIQDYRNLLPASLKNYKPLYEAWNAGKIGRTEIIAHGSTLDPNYYKDAKYFPLTPSQGCLSSKEIWNTSTGFISQSDQRSLTQMIVKAGGPHGYCVVIDLDDKEAAVSVDEIISFLK